MRDVRFAQSPEESAMTEDSGQLLRGGEGEQRFDALLLSGKGKGELLRIGGNVAADDAPDVLACRKRKAHFGEVRRFLIHPLVNHLHTNVCLADVFCSPFQCIVPKRGPILCRKHHGDSHFLQIRSVFCHRGLFARQKHARAQQDNDKFIDKILHSAVLFLQFVSLFQKYPGTNLRLLQGKRPVPHSPTYR